MEMILDTLMKDRTRSYGEWVNGYMDARDAFKPHFGMKIIEGKYEPSKLVKGLMKDE